MPKETPDPSVPSHVLDDPARHALLGPHSEFAERVGDVLRYPPDMSVFTSLPPHPAEADWRDAAKLLGPGEILAAAWDAVPAAPGWEVVMALPGVQLVDDGIAAAPDPEAVRLTAADVPEMTALVESTKPGPLVLAVAYDIRARGEIPFLHAAAGNTNAIRLYKALGFRLRRTLAFGGIRVPAE